MKTTIIIALTAGIMLLCNFENHMTAQPSPDIRPEKVTVLCSIKYRPLLHSLPRYSNGNLVHGSFEIIFTDPEFTCYGFFATDTFTAHSCQTLTKDGVKCSKTYYSQPFNDKNGKSYILFSYSQCPHSVSGYHDNRNLGEIYPCNCSKDIFQSN